MAKRKVDDRVEALLKQSQAYRDSDKRLLLAIWEEEGLHLTEAQRLAFMDCTIAESITRARRKLKGKYPASDPVEKQRFEKFKQYRDEHSRSQPRFF